MLIGSSRNANITNIFLDTYFVPVITFLYADAMGLTGRLISAKINKVKMEIRSSYMYLILCGSFRLSMEYRFPYLWS